MADPIRLFTQLEEWEQRCAAADHAAEMTEEMYERAKADFNDLYDRAYLEIGLPGKLPAPMVKAQANLKVSEVWAMVIGEKARWRKTKNEADRIRIQSSILRSLLGYTRAVMAAEGANTP